MHVSYLNTCRSKTSEKIFTFYIENAKLWCCWFKCIKKKKKLFVMRSHQYHCRIWKKLAEECSFLRSYRVATCSFTKNKTPLQMLFTAWIKTGGSLWRFEVIKLTVVVICLLLTSTIFVVITLYKWSVFLVFRKEEFLMAFIVKDVMSPFALLFLIGYGSTKCNVYSQRNGMIMI